MSVPATVLIPDIQAPYEKKRDVKNVIAFVGDYQPERVVQMGDLLDLPTPSRWNDGTRMEYSQQIRKDSEYVIRTFLKPLRDCYDGPIGILEGNHDLRARKYLADKAPALDEFAADYHMKNLLDFDGFGIELLPPLASAGPDTVFLHGHELKASSPTPGGMAFQFSAKLGKNVVMGHTHKLAVNPITTGHGDDTKLRWGFETGHLMDRKKAVYLGETAVANWQTGFGILYVGKYDVTPVPIYIRRDGSFVVEGERYGSLKRGPNGKFATVQKQL